MGHGQNCNRCVHTSCLWSFVPTTVTPKDIRKTYSMTTTVPYKTRGVFSWGKLEFKQ